MSWRKRLCRRIAFAALYRDVPLNSIWEGSGNVQCLDILRAIHKEPESFEIVLDEIKSATGADKNFDAFLMKLEKEFSDKTNLEFRARSIVEKLALALQASILLKNLPNEISENFAPRA